jgi:hypothetical protein
MSERSHRIDQTQALLYHARAATPFCSEDGEPCASIPSSVDSRRVLALRSASFRDWLTANFYSEFYQRLQKWISNFDATLDEQHEVGVRLVSFGQTFVFHLEALGYWNPSLIFFSGKTEAGEPVELIQHVSQISILLMKLPRKDPTKPKRLIGFGSAEEQG